MKKLLIVGAIAVTEFPIYSWAQYRCIENGKTVITDRACASDTVTMPPGGNSPKIIGDSENSAYSTGYGDWRGQVQYQATQNGQSIPEAHVVVQTTISIDPQGKITGSSPENGCRMKGIVAQGMMPTILNLDVTLSGCKYSDLNRRLTGSLALYPAQKQAQFWLYGMPVDFVRPGRSFDIKGTMRR